MLPLLLLLLLLLGAPPSRHQPSIAAPSCDHRCAGLGVAVFYVHKQGKTVLICICVVKLSLSCLSYEPIFSPYFQHAETEKVEEAEDDADAGAAPTSRRGGLDRMRAGARRRRTQAQVRVGTVLFNLEVLLKIFFIFSHHYHSLTH